MRDFAAAGVVVSAIGIALQIADGAVAVVAGAAALAGAYSARQRVRS